MDWWFAASPDVTRSWLAISEKWEVYRQTLVRMRVARWFSHYVWAIHVHDQLNMTAQLRFKPGVRVNLVRGSYVRLRRGDALDSLGEYRTDAMGNCDTLLTSDGTKRTVNASALLASPVDPNSSLGRRFDARFAPMAEQCALARLDTPVVCCGEPRHCGVHQCGASYADANMRFFQAGQRAGVAAAHAARAQRDTRLG